MTDDTLTEPQAQEKLRHIFRDFNWDGASSRTNIYNFFRKIRDLNRSLPKEIEQSQTVRTCGYEDKEMFPKSEYVQKIQQWLTARR